MAANENTNYHSYTATDKGINAHIVEFDSAAALVDCVRHNITHARWEDYRKDGNADWRYGEYKTAENTAEALDFGKPLEKHYKLYQSILDDLYNKHPELHELEGRARRSKRRRSYNDFDGEVCIDRYLAHNDVCFERMTKRATQSPSVRINYYQPTSGATDAKEFLNGIAHVCAIATIVQAAGLCVRVDLVCALNSLQDGFDHSAFKVVLKDYEEDLDIARLLSAGASGLFREYLFSALKSIANNRVGYGLGRAVNRDQIQSVFNPIFESDIDVFGNDGFHKEGIAEVIDKLQHMLCPNE